MSGEDIVDSCLESVLAWQRRGRRFESGRNSSFRTVVNRDIPMWSFLYRLFSRDAFLRDNRGDLPKFQRSTLAELE